MYCQMSKNDSAGRCGRKDICCDERLLLLRNEDATSTINSCSVYKKNQVDWKPSWKFMLYI